ncbi:MAG: hypothetical protein HY820_00710 [Acidobacteria bacterium]|nr:hypothetical protein [Acidobacteriota bacterium]
MRSRLTVEGHYVAVLLRGANPTLTASRFAGRSPQAWLLGFVAFEVVKTVFVRLGDVSEAANVLRVLVAFRLSKSHLFIQKAAGFDEALDIGGVSLGVLKQHGKVFTLQCEVTLDAFEPFLRRHDVASFLDQRAEAALALLRMVSKRCARLRSVRH